MVPVARNGRSRCTFVRMSEDPRSQRERMLAGDWYTADDHWTERQAPCFSYGVERNRQSCA
jgi:hypothetical protein